jgi:hypothetical protein
VFRDPRITDKAVPFPNHEAQAQEGREDARYRDYKE